MSQPMVPLNDLRRVYASRERELRTAVEATLASGWWLNGEQVHEFCREFARYLGVDNCIGVANGTDALEIAMRALIRVRAPAGREVVTVANAGGYSTTACRLLGLTPVYADIEEATQLGSPESILSCITAETAFVVVTHLYGGVVDVPRLRAMLDEAGHQRLAILEDCAQAHGARIGKDAVGSFGDIAIFSFYPTKNLGAVGDGGAIVTSDPELAQAVQALRQYGWGAKYEVDMPQGRNSRLDELQAAVLRVLLPGLDEGNSRRRKILLRYSEAAPSNVRLVNSGNGSVAHLAVALCERRDELRAHLANSRVATELHYPILDCDQPGWRDLPFRLAPGGIPVARLSVKQLLTLPCFPDMSEDEVVHVCDALAEWEG